MLYLLFCTGKVRILINMRPFLRKFVLVLIMLGLPVQGALAAIMPLCVQVAQAKGTYTGLEPQIHADISMPSAPSAACGQHHLANHEQTVNSEGVAGDMMAYTLPCDGVVCHISGSGLPPAAYALNPISGFSYAASFTSRFTSFILQQPQRPPLA